MSTNYAPIQNDCAFWRQSCAEVGNLRSAQGGIARSLAGVGTRPDSVALCVVRISLARRSLAERAWPTFHGPWADEATVEGESPARVFFHAWDRTGYYSSTRRFIVFSQAFREALIRRYRVRADRINIVPDGVQGRHSTPGFRVLRRVFRLPHY